MLGAGVGVASGISFGELRGSQVWRALCLLTQIGIAGWSLKGQSDECVFQLSGELESRVRKGNITHHPYWGTCNWPEESEVLRAEGTPQFHPWRRALFQREKPTVSVPIL